MNVDALHVQAYSIWFDFDHRNTSMSKENYGVPIDTAT